MNARCICHRTRDKPALGSFSYAVQTTSFRYKMSRKLGEATLNLLHLAAVDIILYKRQIFSHLTPITNNLFNQNALTNKKQTKNSERACSNNAASCNQPFKLIAIIIRKKQSAEGTEARQIWSNDSF